MAKLEDWRLFFTEFTSWSVIVYLTYIYNVQKHEKNKYQRKESIINNNIIIVVLWQHKDNSVDVNDYNTNTNDKTTTITTSSSNNNNNNNNNNNEKDEKGIEQEEKTKWSRKNSGVRFRQEN